MLFLIILSTFILGSHSFAPIWLGSEFSEGSFLSAEDSQELESVCGRINNSAEVKYPWAVSIMLHGHNRLGGSIISPYHILTVAHGFMRFRSGAGSRCVASRYLSKKEIKSRVVVYGGNCNRGRSTTLPNDPACENADVTHNKIRSVMVDSSFAIEGCEHGHDFAIVELENKIEFNQRTAPLCLPLSNPNIDNVVTVPGWGRSDVFKESGPLIHATPMLIDAYCRRPWSDKLPHKLADLICATSLNTSDYFAPRTCHGDSGAGMEQRGHHGRSTLLAMTSFGTHGCPANLLARFTRVSNYLETICSYTGICYSTSKRKLL